MGAGIVLADAGVAANLVGYVIGTMVPIFLIAFARRSAVRWEEQNGDTLPSWIDVSMLVIVVLAVVLAGLNALQISRHVGSLL